MILDHIEQIRRLVGKVAKAITEVMAENIGCPTQAATVLFNEIPQENWAIGGELCQVAKAITEVMAENIGCPTQAVTVLFNEIPQENWAIGGDLCSNIFKRKK